MPLHLHLLCKKTGPGSLQRENLRWPTGDASRLRCGVWLISAADRARKPDFVWLHTNGKATADLGGPVAEIEPALRDDVTDGKPHKNLDRRVTIVFDRAPTARVPWPAGQPLTRQVYCLEER